MKLSSLIFISFQILSYILAFSLQRKKKLKVKQNSFQIPIRWGSSNTVVANISLGNPAQLVPVLLDLGSFYAWVFGTGSICCGTPTTCAPCPVTTFTYSASQTYITKNVQHTIAFIDGQSNVGVYANDTLKMGNAPAMLNFPILVMTNASGSVPGVSGTVGFGYNYGTQTYNSYVQALFFSKQIPSNLFAINTPQSPAQAYFQVGAYDTITYPNLQWFSCNTISPSWTVQYNSFNNIPAASSPLYLVVDSGNSAIYLPPIYNSPQFLSTLSKAGTCYIVSTNVMCPCKTGADMNPLVINLQSASGPVNISLSSVNIVLSAYNGVCTTNFFISTQNQGTLGGPWIRYFYAVFDYSTVPGRVGIAPYSWS